MTGQAPEVGCSAVREPYRFDERRLEEYMRTHVAAFRGPLVVRQFTNGQSNPTYLLITPERRYVLRRKPPGALLSSAHAIDREYRVMTALGTRTDVPVPGTCASCGDESVIGTSFFVMEHVAGRIFWDVSFPEIAREARPAYFDAMNEVLARIHTTDFGAIGLADYGKPHDYLRRQIRRWSGQYREDTAAGRIAQMDRLIDWLGEHVPETEEVALVHGDFRCDNLVFHPTEPRVLAVLDWELSTLGHPLADFAYHLMMYYAPDMAFPGLLGKDQEALNIPPRDRYVAAYCQRTGRKELPDLQFYVAFNFFRFAAICHGIRGRMARGTAVSARAAEYAVLVEQLADLGWAQARGAR